MRPRRNNRKKVNYCEEDGFLTQEDYLYEQYLIEQAIIANAAENGLDTSVLYSDAIVTNEIQTTNETQITNESFNCDNSNCTNNKYASHSIHPSYEESVNTYSNHTSQPIHSKQPTPFINSNSVNSSRNLITSNHNDYQYENQNNYMNEQLVKNRIGLKVTQKSHKSRDLDLAYNPASDPDFDESEEDIIDDPIEDPYVKKKNNQQKLKALKKPYKYRDSSLPIENNYSTNSSLNKIAKKSNKQLNKAYKITTKYDTHDTHNVSLSQSVNETNQSNIHDLVIKNNTSTHKTNNLPITTPKFNQFVDNLQSRKIFKGNAPEPIRKKVQNIIWKDDLNLFNASNGIISINDEKSKATSNVVNPKHNDLELELEDTNFQNSTSEFTEFIEENDQSKKRKLIPTLNDKRKKPKVDSDESLRSNKAIKSNTTQLSKNLNELKESKNINKSTKKSSNQYSDVESMNEYNDSKSNTKLQSNYIFEKTSKIKQKKRKSKKKEENFASLAHYVMYVSDEETPEEIMRRFALMEQMQKSESIEQNENEILDEKQQEELFLLTTKKSKIENFIVLNDSSSDISSFDEYNPNYPDEWEVEIPSSDEDNIESDDENESENDIHAIGLNLTDQKSNKRKSSKDIKIVRKTSQLRKKYREDEENINTVEKVRIFLDLRTYETFTMVHKEIASDGTFPLFSPIEPVNQSKRNKIMRIKNISGPLKSTWGHNYEQIKEFKKIPQKYVQDDLFSFEECVSDEEKSTVKLENHNALNSISKNRFFSSDILLNFDYTTLPQFKQYQVILLSPCWDEWDYHIEPLYMVPFHEILGNNGYVFIWIPKILITEIFAFFNVIGFIYADCFVWVHQDPTIEKSKTLFQENCSHLFIFRMNNNSTKKMDLRHQRSGDAIFDYRPPHTWIYEMIETLLPTTVNKRLHLWAPKNLETRNTWTVVIEERKNKIALDGLLKDANFHIQKILQENPSYEDDTAYDDDDDDEIIDEESELDSL